MVQLGHVWWTTNSWRELAGIYSEDSDYVRDSRIKMHRRGCRPRVDKAVAPGYCKTFKRISPVWSLVVMRLHRCIESQKEALLIQWTIFSISSAVRQIQTSMVVKKHGGYGRWCTHLGWGRVRWATPAETIHCWPMMPSAGVMTAVWPANWSSIPLGDGTLTRSWQATCMAPAGSRFSGHCFSHALLKITYCVSDGTGCVLSTQKSGTSNVPHRRPAKRYLIPGQCYNCKRGAPDVSLHPSMRWTRQTAEPICHLVTQMLVHAHVA